jgi:L-lactate utilization protein LutB
MEALNIIQDILDMDKLVEDNKHDIQNKMDKLLEAMQSEDNIHNFWNQVYQAKNWSFKVFDPEENKMVPVEGDKAPAKIQTYKSQSVKAYKTLKSEKFNELNTWSELKEAIKSEKTEVQVRIEEVYKELKERVKNGDTQILANFEASLGW